MEERPIFLDAEEEDITPSLEEILVDLLSELGETENALELEGKYENQAC